MADKQYCKTQIGTKEHCQALNEEKKQTNVKLYTKLYSKFER